MKKIKTATFKEWDLDKLEQIFNLTQLLEHESTELKNWQVLANTVKITDFEKQTLINLQEPLIWGGRAWNECELENKFISPLIMNAKIDDRTIGYFLERPLSAMVGDYQLSGIVDGIIATGIRSPHTPYFCLHEYKRSLENQRTPDAQVLAAMLVAREINNNQHPIYGLFVIGLVWNFVVLKDNNYCISREYMASNQDIFSLFKMLIALKKIIKSELAA